MKVVIVESPNKIKTISKYLGADYEVLASFGHVRDLPAKDGSVRPDEDFAMSWEVDSKSAKRLADIARAVKGADELILATDPDREGEAISWHVLDVLKQKKAIKKDLPVRRVVFNSITKDAILEAMSKSRQIDEPLVDAYLARRALDYLVGFTLSPILWRKLPGSRSAGRVQSVTLRLVCDREAEIEKFKADEYWSVEAKLAQKGKSFLARLYSVDGKKTDKLDVKTGENAAELKALIEAGNFNVSSVEKKPTKRNPYAPFTTSSLQQDASSRLGLSPSRTMQIAQRLYEDGLITYMRTDAVQMAPEGIAMARSAIGRIFGEQYLPEKARIYQTKAKNAQEAHEAIRPTDMFKKPEDLHIDADQQKLYGLIWRRTLASQMRSAEIDRTTVDISVHVPGRAVELRAVGSVVTFPGFLTLYGVEAKSDEDEIDEDSRELPALAVGDKPDLQAVEIEQHFTQPPSRYTEASLIKKMEELGIGRPSTYAATVTTLVDRDYVRLEGKALHPEDRGRIVTAFLESFFTRYVEYGFTAGLEEQLDQISAGELDYKQVLRDFWTDFTAATLEIKDLRVSEVLDALNDLLADHIFPPKPDGGDPRVCPTCGTGQLSLKLGKFGAFIGCSNYPECKHTMQLSDAATGGSSEAAAGDGILGTDPETGEQVFLKSGRFGPYVQLGEGKEPKRSSLPKGWDAAAMTLDKGLQLLALPRDVGVHPETGLPIVAGLGRYGPFILHDGKYANLPDVEEVFTVGLNRAVDLLAQKAAGGFKRGGAVAAIATFEHANGPITVRSGKYGPYVNQGKINATIPKDIKPEDVTVDQAVEWIAARAEATGTKVKKAPAKKAAAKKPAAKKTTKAAAGDAEAPAKKPAAKKAAPKKKPIEAPVDGDDPF
ncbi:DNA topoisomerase I [Devosia limi DSM 17137]|uniref:DNA topoisomerase 1 n=1 Tax=Devosia limi DSM 17137 TaxID=1121477 RepID=A0A0F5LQ61_9HYPH|nr:type I DNA topoisomerase [Devosia limi]KKB83802.1 DNA topoisomerase I [Devosia limi DSM 17137]SHE69303.1 DNA topoisomerase-1 [Devosia limi DSM 17137]